MCGWVGNHGEEGNAYQRILCTPTLVSGGPSLLLGRGLKIATTWNITVCVWGGGGEATTWNITVCVCVWGGGPPLGTSLCVCVGGGGGHHLEHHCVCVCVGGGHHLEHHCVCVCVGGGGIPQIGC